jgi:DNA repair protein RecO (recombination protein O)
MTMLDAEIYYKQNRDLQQVKELSCSCLYQSIPFSITKSTITLFLAEVLYKSLHEEESNPPLFDFIFNAFQLFDLQDEGMVNFHLYFLVHYSRFLGIFPANDGRLNASTPSHDLQVFTQLPQEAELAINRILAASVADYAAISLSNQNRTVLLERIMQYYAQHLEGMARIRSFQVLKEVFGSL